MSLWFWLNSIMRVNCFHLHATTDTKFWLSCNERNSRKHLHSACKFQHSTALALTNSEGKCHISLSYGTIKNHIIKTTGATNFIPMSRAVETNRNSLQRARVINKTLDPDEGVSNIRLVKELNHVPEPETLSDVRSKCCALHLHTNGN